MKVMDTEANKNKFCLLWQQRPLLTGTEDMGLASDSFRNVKSLKNLENRLETWTTEKCPCGICKVHVCQTGFIEAVPMPFTDLSPCFFVTITNLFIICSLRL